MTKLANPKGRATQEWIGSSPDAKVPDRVKLRVFERHKGICHISGRKIQVGEKWELEHITALSLGGGHRESNLAPALINAHKAKTAKDRKAKAKSDRIRKKHLGIAKSKGHWVKRADFTPRPPKDINEDRI